MKRLGAVLAAIVLAFPTHTASAAEPADTVARFVAAGGVAKRNEAGAVVDLDLRACTVTNADLATIAGLTDLAALAPLVNLKELTLAQTLVRDDDLAIVAKFPRR